MGGHGGLNILPQKRWHVYRDDNRLRVLRDEREFQQALEAERQQQQRRVLNDVVIRLKRRKHEVTGESPAAYSTNSYTRAPSPTHGAAAIQQRKTERKVHAVQNEITALTPAPGLQGAVSSIANGTSGSASVFAPGDRGLFSPAGMPQLGDDRSSCRRQFDTLPTGMSCYESKSERPTMARPLHLNGGRIDPLGREQDGHINFFVEAERKVMKQQKERERYLLQAGHSASRQSEFSNIVRESKSVWYQSEMPSNKLAREEREGCQPNASGYDSVEVAAVEARRRMQALQQQQRAGVTPARPSGVTSKTDTQKAGFARLDSDSSDSDVCIVKECSAKTWGFNNNDGGVAGEVSAKKAILKAGRNRTSRRERKLLKQMKRKWMLEALEFQAKAEGITRQGRIGENEQAPC